MGWGKVIFNIFISTFGPSEWKQERCKLVFNRGYSMKVRCLFLTRVKGSWVALRLDDKMQGCLRQDILGAHVKNENWYEWKCYVKLNEKELRRDCHLLKPFNSHSWGKSPRFRGNHYYSERRITVSERTTCGEFNTGVIYSGIGGFKEPTRDNMLF